MMAPLVLLCSSLGAPFRLLKSVALPSTYLRRTFGEATSEGGAAGGDDGMDDAGNGADGADWFDAVK